jgi:hypothetical protein
VKVFISYSRHDEAASRSLVGRPSARWMQVWLDEKLGGGEDVNQLRKQRAHGAAHACALTGDAAENGIGLRHVKGQATTVLIRRIPVRSTDRTLAQPDRSARIDGC